jgi:RimJ/RimL family protein N-acetyltransferase
MTPGAILETDRLRLREFTPDDAEAFYRLHLDPAVTRYTGDSPPPDVEHARAILVNHPIADYRKYGFGRWACVLKESGACVGFAGLKYLDDLKEVDLGYRLAPACWGRGLATEACRPVVRFGFDRLGLDHIIGLVDPENVASVRVLEKCGLTYAGMIEFRGGPVARYVVQANSGG